MSFDKVYRKYKWFYTSSGKLVVGGKSAKQNDELLSEVKKSGKNYVVMHTSDPGSPFSVIVSEVKKITKKDLEECATFTGCFSRAWKNREKAAKVDIFNSGGIAKLKGMKTGTWSVKGKIRRVNVELKLVIVKQKKLYRAVPENSARKKDILLSICPGKTNKKDMMVKFKLELKDEKFHEDELMSALPAGGVRICK